MDVQVLSHAGALSPGSTLWILPSDPSHTRWLRAVDWYLNFQWSRAQHHQPQTLAPEMHQMAKQSGFDIFYTAPKGAGHLMILSKKLLPNEQTVFVEGEGGTSWLKDALKVWTDLAKPSVRLFVPKGLPLTQVQSVFAESHGNKELSVVLDRGDN